MRGESMTTKPSQYSQSEIDRHNRYLKRYNTMETKTQADIDTYNTIKNMYGGIGQSGLLDPNSFGGKQERAYRRENPFSEYAKNKELRFLNQVDTNLVNNAGVSTPQFDEYNKLASKWNIDPTKNRVTTQVTKEVQNQIDMQKKAIEDSLAKQRQASELAVNQNNSFLQEQIKNFNNQKVVNDNQAANLSNRRGGFYSGGLDYQLGQNAKATQEASGKVSQEIAMRNADINNRNALLAEQAAKQIELLQTQAPELIQQRIRQELDRQRGINMQEAQLTGQYNGQQTMQAQQQQFQQQFAQQQFAYQKARDLIGDERWKMQFDQSVSQFGLEFALREQVQNNQLTMDQARLALSQQQFDADQYWKEQEFALGQMPQPADLKKYADQLNKTFLAKDEDSGQYSVTNPEGLYKAILGLNLSDDETLRLINMYGIGNFINP